MQVQNGPSLSSCQRGFRLRFLHGAENRPFISSDFGTSLHTGPKSHRKQADFKLMSTRPMGANKGQHFSSNCNPVRSKFPELELKKGVFLAPILDRMY